MTATLPDRETPVTSTQPSDTPAQSAAPKRPQARTTAQPRPPRPGDDLWTVVSTAGTMVAIVCLWVLVTGVSRSGSVAVIAPAPEAA